MLYYEIAALTTLHKARAKRQFLSICENLSDSNTHGRRHFWGMPRAMRGTTPCDLARELLRREHRQLAPARPCPILATLAQHCWDGLTLAFLLAAMHGTNW